MTKHQTVDVRVPRTLVLIKMPIYVESVTANGAVGHFPKMYLLVPFRYFPYLGQIMDRHLGGGRLGDSDEMQQQESEGVSICRRQTSDGILDRVD